MEKPAILVAPLNWGLGHATRCIPIINALIIEGFEPILASDGVALQLLRKEFPDLITLELPSYDIAYAKKAAFFKWKLIKNSPKMLDAILKEKKQTQQWVQEYNLVGIISDNRLGVYSKIVPSVFLTHQINVLTGKTSWITSKMHQFIIKKYTECWVPDLASSPNLSGELGHLSYPHFKINYIGPLSRLEKKNLPKIYHLMILLSGPEPQRTMLEHLLLKSLESHLLPCVFVLGKIEAEQKVDSHGCHQVYNFMTKDMLETTINQSEFVVSRSGYTTVMDLAALGKKAFFIPTPGQYEQEYLAKKLKKEGLVSYAKQDKFDFDKMLTEIEIYQGLAGFESKQNWSQLFKVFLK
jgi:uncharacterized protein (TIGR00661 family)